LTSRFVVELEAEGQEKGEDKFDKCFAIVNELQVGGWLLKIDGDRAVLPRRFGGLSHVSSPLKSRRVWMRHREDNALKDQVDCERAGASPLNPLECGKSYYDIRHAVLHGAPADLLPKRPGPHHPSKRTKEVEARIIRMRFETDLNRDEIAETFTQMGFKVSARLVGQVLADYGLSKKNGPHLPRSRHGSSPKKTSTSSTAPANRAHASSPATTSSTTSPPNSNGD
jgi:hypothetical protein